MGYNPDAASQAMWPYYSGIPNQPFYPGVVTDASARIPEYHTEALGLPPLVPSVQPNALDPTSLARDSPRSVILTLGGAWGALTAGSPEKQKQNLTPAAVFTRDELLKYRIASSGGRKPTSVKSLKVSARS